jgi:hypothetical protein
MVQSNNCSQKHHQHKPTFTGEAFASGQRCSRLVPANTTKEKGVGNQNTSMLQQHYYAGSRVHLFRCLASSLLPVATQTIATSMACRRVTTIASSSRLVQPHNSNPRLANTGPKKAGIKQNQNFNPLY